MPKLLCIDFDDTLCNRSTNEPIDGTLEALSQFKSQGYTILISSSRLNPELWGEQVKFRIKEISDWLEKHKIPYNKIVMYKPAADLYIDNKGYRFKGDWKIAAAEISKMI